MIASNNLSCCWHKTSTIDEFIKDCFKAVGINPKPFPLPNTKLSPHIVELLTFRNSCSTCTLSVFMIKKPIGT